MPKRKKVKQKILLDIGCGFNKQKGFIGMDKRNVDGVDIVHDVEKFPWPLDNESCSVVVMSHLIEHIKPWLQIDVMDEAWRIIEVGGILAIATPHGESFGYLQDPTHCAPWVEATIDYFCAGTFLYNIYRPKPWTLDLGPDNKPKFFFSKKGNLEVVFRKITEEAGKEICENAEKK